MNVLIFGLGSIALKHIDVLRILEPSAVIYAFRSSHSSRTFDGVTNIYTLKELTVAPDFIIISNPTRLHEETIRTSIKFNCPIFIEKPVLHDLVSADAIERIVNDNNIVTYSACNLRFHPALISLKKYLDEKRPRINEVNIYCGSFLPLWREGTHFRQDYSANPDMGGGVHLDLIHEIDYCTWLLGKPSEVKNVKRSNSSLDIHAVDFAAYHLLYPDFSANIVLNYYRKDIKRIIEIVCENDTIIADLLACTLVSKVSNETLFEKPFLMRDTYYEQMKYFLSHLKQKTHPMNNFSEAVSILKIALS